MHPAWRAFSRTIEALNWFTGYIGGVLIVVSCVLVTNEIVMRYFLKFPQAWNLETNIFLLIAATFLGANYTQMKRGHVGADVLSSIMSASWNRWRVLVGDVLSFLLCAFLAVRVWEYTYKAWSEGWTTPSLWSPPLWIPFSLIGLGLMLISLEYVVQIIENTVYRKGRAV